MVGRPGLRLKRKSHFARLRAYAELDWHPWTQDGPTDALFPSDESMCAAAEPSRTAYSIMHLTKDELITLHRISIIILHCLVGASSTGSAKVAIVAQGQIPG
jgi:hypothetical protein